MLIAGGIGITHPMSFLYEFVHGFDTGTVATRKVRLVWVVRSLGKLPEYTAYEAKLINQPYR